MNEFHALYSIISTSTGICELFLNTFFSSFILTSFTHKTILEWCCFSPLILRPQGHHRFGLKVVGIVFGVSCLVKVKIFVMVNVLPIDLVFDN